MSYKNPNDPRAKESRLRHYYKNPKPYKDRAIARKKKLLQFIRKLKDNPCFDCGIKYPYYVMHFDHLRDKKHNISRMHMESSESGILEEVSKCELVCSNCHAERTHSRIALKSL